MSALRLIPLIIVLFLSGGAWTDVIFNVADSRYDNLSEQTTISGNLQEVLCI